MDDDNGGREGILMIATGILGTMQRKFLVVDADDDGCGVSSVWLNAIWECDSLYLSFVGFSFFLYH